MNPVNPMTTRQLRRACHAAAHMAEIGKPVSPHTLRHYVASRTMSRACGRLGNFGRKLRIAKRRGSGNHAT
jgi:integrase